MKKEHLIYLLLVILFMSCQKTEEDNTIELLNGSYTGNIYKWHRDYDSTHTTVIETFDTIYNATSILEINQNNNQIKFGGILYSYHDDLINNIDTIKGVVDYSTLPYRSIEIIKSLKFVRLYTSAYAPTGPWAFTQNEEYYKD